MPVPSIPTIPTLSRRGSAVSSPSNASGLLLPGTAGNYVTTPDSAALSIAGDIDVRAKVAMTSWSPASDQAIVGKWSTTGATSSYLLNLMSGADVGKLEFLVSTVAPTIPFAKSNATLGLTDGSTKWVRGTWVQSTGVMTLFTSDDGSAWTTVPSTTSNANTSLLVDNATAASIGAQANGTTGIMAGNVYRAQILNGIGGTTIADFNPSLVVKTGTRAPTTYTDAQGNVWTVNGSAWAWL
jgi:hypothetical protein